MNNIKTKTKLVDEEKGLMIRVDRTLNEIMEEKPSSRWDAHYWHPKYEKNLQIKYKLFLLQDVLINNHVISVDHVRDSRDETIEKVSSPHHPAFYYTVDGIVDTGYDLRIKRYISEKGYQRLQRGELSNGNIAVAISGVGSIGKSFIKYDGINKNTTGDLYVLKIYEKLYNPFFLSILLKSPFGKLQLERNEKGVSGQTKLTADMLEYLKIPIIDKAIQDSYEVKYKKILKLHNELMENTTNLKSDKQKFDQIISEMGSLTQNLETLLRE